MSKLGVFFTIFITFLIAYVIGARTFHPVYMIEYKYPINDIEKCNGVIQISGEQLSCLETKMTFSHPINNSYVGGNK